MKILTPFIDFILKEWLVIVSAVALLATSLYTKHIPRYSASELEVLFILFALFVAINGFVQSNLILKTAQSIEKGSLLALKLLLATFFLSMIVTNDIALIIMVPLTLALKINGKDILVILEAISANAGSALTPIGNPQNLFIYWFYHIRPSQFIQTIAPFSLTFFILLIVVSLFIKTPKVPTPKESVKISKKALVYFILLTITLLSVFHLLPIFAASLVIIYALIFDKKALKIDYALLFTFLFFFGIADNLKVILATNLNRSEHIFILSALASQIMSNVPATLLFAKFTNNWQALLWGSNAGGFGSLFGSLANLIAYKFYINSNQADIKSFSAKFLIIGYIAFAISIALFNFIT